MTSFAFTIKRAASLAFALFFAGSSSADEALYDAAIPQDAVFIRWLAATENASVFGQTFDATRSKGRDYLPVSHTVLKGAQPGGFYSVFEDRIIEEPARDDASKVHLILLNLSAAPARLVVAGKDVEVIGATGEGEALSRAVNPVQATLSVTTDTGELGRFDLSLRRGQNITFVVHENAATMIENGFGPVAEVR